MSLTRWVGMGAGTARVAANVPVCPRVRASTGHRGSPRATAEEEEQEMRHPLGVPFGGTRESSSPSGPCRHRSLNDLFRLPSFSCFSGTPGLRMDDACRQPPGCVCPPHMLPPGLRGAVRNSPLPLPRPSSFARASRPLFYMSMTLLLRSMACTIME